MLNEGYIWSNLTVLFFKVLCNIWKILLYSLIPYVSTFVFGSALK